MTHRFALALQVVALVIVFPDRGMSEVPPTINYQAKVLDAVGNVVSGPLDLEVGLWDSADGGQLLYHEQQLDTPAVDGVINLLIGTGTNPTGELNASTFSGDRWLEVSVEGETLAPRQPLSAVAYAFQADQAEFATTAGDVSVRTTEGDALVVVQLLPSGAGFVSTRGPNGNSNVQLTSDSSNPDLGLVTVHDANGTALAQMNVVASSNAGFVGTRGPNGNDNVQLTAHPNNPDLGLIAVQNTNGATRAQMTTSASSGAGYVATHGPNGQVNVQLSSAAFSADVGFVGVGDASGASRVQMQALPAGDGYISTRGPNGNVNAELTSNADTPDHGRVTVKDADGAVRAHMQVLSADAGFVGTLGPNGSANVELKTSGNNPDFGVVVVYDADGELRATMLPTAGGAGTVLVAGANGKVNAAMSASVENPDHGQISVFDANGATQAGIRVNADGQGEVFADVKEFVVDYPGRPGSRITYTTLEGPEVGIYCRGVVQLINGMGRVTLPEHFTALASPGSLTIQLTPISFDSRGVGFEIRGDGQIEVRELNGGTGSYAVHFTAYAVRRGYESFQPVVNGSAAAAPLDATLQAMLADVAPGRSVASRGGSAAAAPMRASLR